MASSFLERILAEKAREVARRKVERPEPLLRARCAEAAPARDVLKALTTGSLAVIAEIKRGSPSKGVFRADLDAAEYAAVYAAAGAAMVSVLTDGPNFGGSLDDLSRARARVDVPLLRKDFIVDEYQLVEARANGADAVLLIVAALEFGRLRSLFDAAMALGLMPLVEIKLGGRGARGRTAGRAVGGYQQPRSAHLRRGSHHDAALAVAASAGHAGRGPEWDCLGRGCRPDAQGGR